MTRDEILALCNKTPDVGSVKHADFIDYVVVVEVALQMHGKSWAHQLKNGSWCYGDNFHAQKAWASWATLELHTSTLTPNGNVLAAFKMFRAALTSRWIERPQSGQWCQRSESSLRTKHPQLEQTCEV